MNQPEIVLKRLAVAMRSEWASMVEMAMQLRTEELDSAVAAIAQNAKVGTDSVKRKLEAIIHARTLGHSPEEITEMGQEKILGTFIKSRRQEKYSETVTMKWMIPGSQRELVQQQEKRVKQILNLQTSESFWDFMLSVLRNATDEEIRNSAGEHDAPRQD